MFITFGRLIHPPFRDRLIPDANTRAWDDLGQREPVGVVLQTTPEKQWKADRVAMDGSECCVRPRVGRTERGKHSA